MNRSRYVIRQIDKTDRAIISALFENGRMTLRELAEVIDLSSPSVTDRIEKLKDAGAIQGYTAIIDPKAFGLGYAHQHQFTGDHTADVHADSLAA